MTSDSHSSELFIVDNSVSGWTGLRYLEQWCAFARMFDIATGYFEIGALLVLNENWQKLDKIRILMGADTTQKTRKVLLQSIQSKVHKKLDNSIEEDKERNPFLHGVSEILDAFSSGRIECRIYYKGKFHAKTYITHPKPDLEMMGSRALVGSSNFTKPGLTDNIELNVHISSVPEVRQLQVWFETYWDEGKDISDDIVETVTRHTRLYTPFDVYAKALQQYFRGHELTDAEWDESQSQMFRRLDRYQKEAYWALVKIAQQYGGAFLCDGVGLGKTFVGLMLIERLVLHDGKRVALFAPKAAKEGVWAPHLREWLPHIGGVGGGGDFSNLALFSHTDLGRKGEFPERFRRIKDLADVVIIDEAHHFRNLGRRGDLDKGIEPSRYNRLFDLLDNSPRPKTLYMLTATPINNHLSDFRHMTELFTRRDERYFADKLGIHNLRSHFNKMEKAFQDRIGKDHAIVSDHISETQDILTEDKIFRSLVVQRSRAYACESQRREHGQATAFPHRQDPRVAEYSLKATYGQMLDLVERAFAKDNPLFTLPMYYPLHWYQGSNEDIDSTEENRQKQVVGLIRTNFLKRFESSIAAFEKSCRRLLQKLFAFIAVHSVSDSEKSALEEWKLRNQDIFTVRERDDDGDSEGDDYTVDDIVPDEDIVSSELLEDVAYLDRTEYDIDAMLEEAFKDLDQIAEFLREAQKFEPKHDDKLQTLIRLLKKDMKDQKVLIFTEYADTARYLKYHIVAENIKGVEQVDSTTQRNRADVIRCFAPYYNGSSSEELAAEGHLETRILISTDVLSEGLNLQDASRMINYDIHWNPVRLMQRIGRVDRRMNLEIEKKMVVSHPEVNESRGKVWFWNFLPPAELNRILSLYTRVTQKTLLISKTFGIEGRKLFKPDDDFEALREFNQSYEGTTTALEEMHLEYQALLQKDPNLEKRLSDFPSAIFSGRTRTKAGVRGIFFCYALPELDNETGGFTEDAGTVGWYLYDLDRDEIVENVGDIFASIRTEHSISRRCVISEDTLLEVRQKIEQHIKNTHLKPRNAPLGVKQRLCCWMELNEGTH